MCLEEDKRMAKAAQNIDNKTRSHGAKSQTARSLHSILGALVGISMTVTVCLIIISVKRGVDFGILNKGNELIIAAKFLQILRIHTSV